MYNPKEYGGQALANVNPGLRQAGLTDVSVNNGSKIYRSVDKDGKVTFTGMGAPSRIAAEVAKANDPEAKKAAYVDQLRQQAAAGNVVAGKVLGDMMQADAQIEAERLRGASGLEQAKVTAGAKAAGKKDDGASLNDLIKLGTTLIGEGREAELIQAVNQRKQVAVDQLIKAGKIEQAKQVAAAEPDQDFIIGTANLMKQRDEGAQNSQGSRAGAGAAIGSVVGGLAGLGAGLYTKKPKLIRAGLGGLAGGLGLGGYGYATGSQGVDEFTDLNRIAALGANNGDLVGDGIVIPGDFLPEDQQVLRGIRR